VHEISLLCAGRTVAALTRQEHSKNLQNRIARTARTCRNGLVPSGKAGHMAPATTDLSWEGTQQGHGRQRQSPRDDRARAGAPPRLGHCQRPATVPGCGPEWSNRHLVGHTEPTTGTDARGAPPFTTDRPARSCR
jgi:hypothetical protein